MSIENKKALEVLREFLNFPHNPEAVFDKFKNLDGAYQWVIIFETRGH